MIFTPTTTPTYSSIDPMTSCVTPALRVLHSQLALEPSSQNGLTILGVSGAGDNVVANRKRRRSSRSRKRAPKQDFPGWLWMLFGLSARPVGCVSLFTSREIVPTPVPGRCCTGTGKPAEAPWTTTVRHRAAATEHRRRPKKSRFTFYDVLPNFEVIGPGRRTPDVAVRCLRRRRLSWNRGSIRAASRVPFPLYTDADRRRAELALHGIESHIQTRNK